MDHPSQQAAALAAVQSSPYTIVKLGQQSDYSNGSSNNNYHPLARTNYPSSNTIYNQHYPSSNTIHNQHSSAYNVNNVNQSGIISISNNHSNQLGNGGGGAYYNTSNANLNPYDANHQSNTSVYATQMMDYTDMPSMHHISNNGHLTNTSIHHNDHSNGHDAYLSHNGSKIINPQQHHQQQNHQHPSHDMNYVDPQSNVYSGVSNGTTASSNQYTASNHILPKIKIDKSKNYGSHSSSDYHSDYNSKDRNDGQHAMNISNLSSINNNSSTRSSVVTTTKALLSNSKDDLGRSLQLFSFRSNNWERIDVIDYEPSKQLHKCVHIDGTIQWLDLGKKPVRDA